MSKPWSTNVPGKVIGQFLVITPSLCPSNHHIHTYIASYFQLGMLHELHYTVYVYTVRMTNYCVLRTYIGTPPAQGSGHDGQWWIETLASTGPIPSALLPAVAELTGRIDPRADPVRPTPSGECQVVAVSGQSYVRTCVLNVLPAVSECWFCYVSSRSTCLLSRTWPWASMIASNTIRVRVENGFVSFGMFTLARLHQLPLCCLFCRMLCRSGRQLLAHFSPHLVWDTQTRCWQN